MKIPTEDETGFYPGSAAPDPICRMKLGRISEIDQMFEAATGWGSWMVMCANERERLVNELNAFGVGIEHKWLARCGGNPTD